MEKQGILTDLINKPALNGKFVYKFKILNCEIEFTTFREYQFNGVVGDFVKFQYENKDNYVKAWAITVISQSEVVDNTQKETILSTQSENSTNTSLTDLNLFNQVNLLLFRAKLMSCNNLVIHDLINNVVKKESNLQMGLIFLELFIFFFGTDYNLIDWNTNGNEKWSTEKRYKWLKNRQLQMCNDSQKIVTIL